MNNIINNLISIDNGWYSHRRVLVDEINKLSLESDVNILEFGTGNGSAEIFYQYCKQYPTFKVTAFDNSLDWLNQMKNSFELENYNFNLTTEWETTLKEIDYNKKYDLVFVDQAPWSARIETIDFLRDKNVNTIILHDYDQYNFNDCNGCKAKLEADYLSIGIGSFFERFMDYFDMESYYDNKPNWPPTLILRNKKFL